MSNFHIVLMYCIPSPLAALKFWYWLTQVHLDNGHKHWEREMETERERERERERCGPTYQLCCWYFFYISCFTHTV